MEALVRQKKCLVLILAKQRKNLKLHYNGDNNYLKNFCYKKKIYKFKADNKNVNFSTQICLRCISSKFHYVVAEEVSLSFNFQSIMILLVNLL